MPAQHFTREQWLRAAIVALRPRFAAIGYPVPDAVRVSCGLPSRGAFNITKRSIGEAWSSKASRDQHHEIFISPTIEAPAIVLAVLAHELVHVAVGIDKGHRGHFIMCAGALGLMGPWTAAKVGDELAGFLGRLAGELGAYPHGSLDKMTNMRKKQSTRLIKAGCPACGYTTRITLKWLLLAVPTCPVEECERYGDPFEVNLPSDFEDPKHEGERGQA